MGESKLQRESEVYFVLLSAYLLHFSDIFHAAVASESAVLALTPITCAARDAGILHTMMIEIRFIENQTEMTQPLSISQNNARSGNVVCVQCRGLMST